MTAYEKILLVVGHFSVISIAVSFTALLLYMAIGKKIVSKL
jgi:hypothetical protein